MEHSDPTAQRLIDAFARFARAEWRERPIQGLKRSEIRALFCIRNGTRNGGKMKVSEISQKLYVTMPTVTQLLKHLIAAGLVVRSENPDDRRAVGIELTEKGEQVAQEAAQVFRDSINGLIAHLGTERSEQLADLLNESFQYYMEQEDRFS